jgi:hypothetical protein
MTIFGKLAARDFAAYDQPSALTFNVARLSDAAEASDERRLPCVTFRDRHGSDLPYLRRTRGWSRWSDVRRDRVESV